MLRPLFLMVKPTVFMLKLSPPRPKKNSSLRSTLSRSALAFFCAWLISVGCCGKPWCFSWICWSVFPKKIPQVMDFPLGNPGDLSYFIYYIYIYIYSIILYIYIYIYIYLCVCVPWSNRCFCVLLVIHPILEFPKKEHNDIKPWFWPSQVQTPLPGDMRRTWIPKKKVIVHIT